MVYLLLQWGRFSLDQKEEILKKKNWFDYIQCKICSIKAKQENTLQV